MKQWIIFLPALLDVVYRQQKGFRMPRKEIKQIRAGILHITHQAVGYLCLPLSCNPLFGELDLKVFTLPLPRTGILPSAF